MSLKLHPEIFDDQGNKMTLLQRVCIAERICTEEAGSLVYPASEACFTSIESWERTTGRNFFREFSTLYRAGWGAA